MAKKNEGMMMEPEAPKHVGEIHGIDFVKHAKFLKNMKVGKKFKAVIHAEKVSHNNDMGSHRGTIRIHKIKEEGKAHEAKESAAYEASEGELA